MPYYPSLRLIAISAGAFVLSACVDRAPFPSEAASPNLDQVKWVLISPAVATISISQRVRFDAQFQDRQLQSISSRMQWSSSDTTVATVNDSGVVLGRKVGVVRIAVASATAGAYAEVHVTPTLTPAIQVKVAPSSVTLAVPATTQLTSSVTFTSGKNVPGAIVTWMSSNTAVATVTSSGLVSAISAGTATVTVRSSTSSASASITVKDKAPASSQPTEPTQPAQPPAPAPASGSLFSGYSPVSPHWQHIRTALTDFYDRNGWTSTERAWDGQHYDLVMGGDASAWHTVNSGIRHYQYVLLQATTIPTATLPASAVSQWYSDALQWYAAHPQFNIETAFLHQAGQPADSAHRLKPWGWDTYTWIINPSDSGLIAYSEDRFVRLSANEDGLFIDSQGSGDLAKNLHDNTSTMGSREYPNSASGWPPTGQYYADYAALLRTLKAAVGSRTLQPNTSGYNFDPDFADVTAAGATHMEKVNNPLSSAMVDNWTWIDKLLGVGVDVNMVNALDYEDMNAVVAKYFGGTADSAYHRIKMAELASYYMVVPPSPDRLELQLLNLWGAPASARWLKAQEANIGHPTGKRLQVTGGVAPVDPTGQLVHLFMRDFDRALVLFRAQTGWGAQRYDDATAVTVALPTGETWLPLHPDGTLGAAVTSVKLRNADAVILIKARTIQTS